jgi:hypothetical protein
MINLGAMGLLGDKPYFYDQNKWTLHDFLVTSTHFDPLALGASILEQQQQVLSPISCIPELLNAAHMLTIFKTGLSVDIFGEASTTISDLNTTEEPWLEYIGEGDRNFRSELQQQNLLCYDHGEDVRSAMADQVNTNYNYDYTEKHSSRKIAAMLAISQGKTAMSLLSDSAIETADDIREHYMSKLIMSKLQDYEPSPFEQMVGAICKRSDKNAYSRREIPIIATMQHLYYKDLAFDHAINQTSSYERNATASNTAYEVGFRTGEIIGSWAPLSEYAACIAVKMHDTGSLGIIKLKKTPLMNMALAHMSKNVKLIMSDCQLASHYGFIYENLKTLDIGNI